MVDPSRNKNQGNPGVERRKSNLRRSLIGEKTIGGVDSRLAILNFTVVGSIAYGTQWYPLLLIAVVTHWLLRNVTSRDPNMLLVYRKYSGQGLRYDPWPHRCKWPEIPRGERPEGFAKDMPW